MKICYIADAGSIHTQRWVKYFADKGHAVHLISPRPFGDNSIKNVRLYVLRKLCPQIRIISYLINLLFYVIQVRRLIKKIKPDILHAHYATGPGFWGMLSGFHPFVLTTWGSDILVDPRRYPPLKIFTKYTLRKADLITCEGENMKEAMVNLGANAQKINIIYFGVDTKKFSPEERDEELRERLQISGSPTVISIRNLRPLYDVESLVRAIPLVLERVPKTKFIIAGDGDQRKYLENLAISLGVSDSVRFVGMIPHDKLPKYLASADIYVSTSLSEGGIAVSTLEAMACGLPVVTTDSGDNVRWITDGEHGFIVPVKAPGALASKITHLLLNENVRYRFGHANRRLIKEKAEYEREMLKMEKLYEGLVKESR